MNPSTRSVVIAALAIVCLQEVHSQRLLGEVRINQSTTPPIFSFATYADTTHPDTSSARDLWKPFDATTMAFQAPVGLALGAVGASLAYLSPGGYGGLVIVGVLGLSGYVAGVSGGVYLVGQAMGGNGSFMESVTWSGYGMLGGLALGSVAEAKKGELVASTMIGHLVGAIVGYHLSASEASGVPHVDSIAPGNMRAVGVTPLREQGPYNELFHLSIPF